VNRIEYLKKQLTEYLEKFKSTPAWGIDELTVWYIQCLMLLEEIGINDNLLDNFSTYFNPHLIQSNDNASLFILLDQGPLKTKFGSTHMMTINGVFEFAFKKLETMEEEERLIPKFLINYFKEKEEYGAIFTTLKTIEDSVSGKNIDTLITSANTLLDLILDSVEELKGKKLGTKLTLLKDNKVLSESLSINSEIILALNNCRITRNEGLIHPLPAAKNSIPYIMAVSYAHLVIMTLINLLSVGKLS
jgi:hypothetical protein